MDSLLIIGDLLHILAVLYLLFGILNSKNAGGLSYRTQEMMLLVFLARFSDMIITDHPFLLYLVVTRTLLIAATIATIYSMRLSTVHSKNFDREMDSFPHLWIYMAVAIISLAFPEHHSLYGYLWTFSIWLQALAIIPQLFMLFIEAEINSLTCQYVQVLTIYRSFYILHWVFAWQKAKELSVMAGILQLALYSWFIYKQEVRRRIVEFMILPS